MVKKLASWVKENPFLFVAGIFIWIIPLILLVILACESKAGTGFTLWGSVCLAVIIIVYFVKIKGWLNRKADQYKVEINKVPVSIRIANLCAVACVFIFIILMLNATQTMFHEMMVFVICVFASVFVGHIFLIADSKNRKAQKIVRENVDNKKK